MNVTEMKDGPVETEALWYLRRGCAAIRNGNLGNIKPGQVRVRALFSAISRGTESLVFDGAVPEAEWGRMRAPMQEGDFPFPVKYGYQSVGRVIVGPEDMLGHCVFALHPHQTSFDASIDSVTVVPDEIPAARATLAGNMQTALTGLWDARPAPGDHIAVVGGGVVGLLTAWLCAKIPATSVMLVDTNPEREEIARDFGLSFAAPSKARGNNDLVIHASASEAGLETALALAGEEAAIVEMSWYGDRAVKLALGGAFHSRRLRLVASQVGRIPDDHKARWDFARRNETAMRLLADPRLDRLLETPIPFRDLPQRLPDIFKKDSGILCQLVEYG